MDSDVGGVRGWPSVRSAVSARVRGGGEAGGPDRRPEPAFPGSRLENGMPGSSRLTNPATWVPCSVRFARASRAPAALLRSAGETGPPAARRKPRSGKRAW